MPTVLTWFIIMVTRPVGRFWSGWTTWMPVRLKLWYGQGMGGIAPIAKPGSGRWRSKWLSRTMAEAVWYFSNQDFRSRKTCSQKNKRFASIIHDATANRVVQKLAGCTPSSPSYNLCPNLLNNHQNTKKTSMTVVTEILKIPDIAY